jgi:two-component system chemotaxis response regulator CheY
MAKSALVVDDSKSLRQMVTFALQQAGFEIIEADNGATALKALEGKRVNLVISDVNMPVMDGLTFVKKLRALDGYKFVPVLMLTTESGDSKKAEGKAAGATGWIVKPFDVPQLLEVVKKVVH